MVTMELAPLCCSSLRSPNGASSVTTIAIRKPLSFQYKKYRSYVFKNKIVKCMILRKITYSCVILNKINYLYVKLRRGKILEK